MRRIWIVGVILSLMTGAAFAQGTQTGVISGTVTSSDGASLPGVTVTVKSNALIGTRSAVSDTNGGYIFKGLPPGAYEVTFELSSFTTVKKSVQLALGATIPTNAEMGAAAVEETITVTAETDSVTSTSQVGANYKREDIDSLATPRTLQGIAELAPGLTDNTPNRGQLTISGGFAYDNAFLIDGVDVQDNLFGSPDNLFIEDAIEETQVLTSGVSAEYGRFGGGVINAVTKRGGNTFSGTFRTNFTNSAWTDETPFEKSRGTERPSQTNKSYEATLGGPFIKDRLWFFVAGRKADTSTANVFPDLGTPVTTTQDNQRFEGKLSGNIAPNHALTGTYLRNSTDQTQPSFGFATNGLRSIDPRTIDSRSLPNSLFVGSYTGVLSPSLFLEAQYSQKKFAFSGSGGSGTDLVNDSPFLTAGVTTPVLGLYNAPYFDESDNEDRNNRQITAALSYYLSTSNLGAHDIKTGFENFRTTNKGGNSQSPTDYVFYADYLTNAAGAPVLDANGRYIPVFVPGESLRTQYIAQRGSILDITTNSFFVNDKWRIDNKWSANLGLRYERVRSEATGEIVAIDTDTFTPRLGLSFDVKGDGKFRLDGTYAHYAGGARETQFGDSSNVGNPNALYQVYTGPAGQGLDFAPGFSNASYETVGGVFPTANVTYQNDISSQLTKEWTLAASTTFAGKGYLKLIYSNRRLTDFVEDFTLFENGATTVVRDGVELGTFDNVVIGNSDEPRREYQALQLQAQYRLTDKWNLAGGYTYQIKNEGDFEGENINQPGQTSAFGDRPEVFVPSRNFPIGRLNDFQRHKVRAWTTYDLGLGRAGEATVSLFWRFDSALTYSLVANNVPLSAIQQARDPGYTGTPPIQALFFGERGSGDFNPIHLFDVAVNYEIPIFKTFRPWAKFEVTNAFNNDKLTSFNTTVARNTAGPVDGNGLATEFIRGPLFGQATGNNNFAVPRTVQFSLGFRF